MKPPTPEQILSFLENVKNQFVIERRYESASTIKKTQKLLEQHIKQKWSEDILKNIDSTQQNK